MIFEDTQDRVSRAIRIDTVDGPIEGQLQVGPKLRTLDDLNMVSKRFVTLHSPSSSAPDWNLGQGTVAISKASVLFVRELSPPPVQSSKRFSNFSRSPIRMRIKGGHEIEGFLHVPVGGAPMKRLEHGEHPFISLTTVLVNGPEGQSTAPFLAVNRAHISAVQEVDLDEGEAPGPVPSGASADASAG